MDRLWQSLGHLPICSMGSIMHQQCQRVYEGLCDYATTVQEQVQKKETNSTFHQLSIINMMIFQDSILTIQSQGEMHNAVFTQEKEYKDSIQTIQSQGEMHNAVFTQEKEYKS